MEKQNLYNTKEFIDLKKALHIDGNIEKARNNPTDKADIMEESKEVINKFLDCVDRWDK